VPSYWINIRDVMEHRTELTLVEALCLVLQNPHRLPIGGYWNCRASRDPDLGEFAVLERGLSGALIVRTSAEIFPEAINPVNPTHAAA
ncbi:MAG TPA: hypothetical protein VFQ60_01160, partial [Patescibacteria group bacterium]|nr:hypothetical protein [Patescibacteria group bacterium]